MADNEYDSPKPRRCVYGQCGKLAEDDAPWGMGFCEFHKQKAHAEIDKQLHAPRRQMPEDLIIPDGIAHLINCTHCDQPYTDDNPPVNGRKCRNCERAEQAKYRECRRAEKNAARREKERAAAERAERRRVEEAEREQRRRKLDAERLAKDIETGKACESGHRWVSLAAVYEYTNLGCESCAQEFARRQLMALSA